MTEVTTRVFKTLDVSGVIASSSYRPNLWWHLIDHGVFGTWDAHHLKSRLYNKSEMLTPSNALVKTIHLASQQSNTYSMDFFSCWSSILEFLSFQANHRATTRTNFHISFPWGLKRPETSKTKIRVSPRCQVFVVDGCDATFNSRNKTLKIFGVFIEKTLKVGF